MNDKDALHYSKLTESLKTCLERSKHIAKILGFNQVEVEHLLMGIISKNDSIGRKATNSFGHRSFLSRSFRQ
jgi:ATP-dependent Clp protease ATP-binding subunit ClpA